MSYVHRCIIVPAAITSTCQQLSEALSGEGGAGMWKTGLSATGAEPATHYISSGMISIEFAAMISDPQVMLSGCEAMGLPVTIEQCEAILGAADVSEDMPFAAMERIGLVLVASNIEI